MSNPQTKKKCHESIKLLLKIWVFQRIGVTLHPYVSNQLSCRSLEITTQKTHTQKRRLPCSRVLYGDVGFGSINMSMKVWFIDPESHIESP